MKQKIDLTVTKCFFFLPSNMNTEQTVRIVNEYKPRPRWVGVKIWNLRVKLRPSLLVYRLYGDLTESKTLKQWEEYF